MDARAPFVPVVIKKSNRMQPQTAFHRQLSRQTGAHVPRADDADASRSSSRTALRSQEAFADQPETQAYRRQSAERKEEVNQQHAARRREKEIRVITQAEQNHRGRCGGIKQPAKIGTAEVTQQPCKLAET